MNKGAWQATAHGVTKSQTRLNDFTCKYLGFAGGSDGKESACKAGDLGSVPGLGRSPGEGNGNPLQYSCLENPMDKGAWWAPRKELDMTERLHFLELLNGPL